MKRYRLMYRGSRDTYYVVDSQTKKRESLDTNSEAEAQRLLDIKNKAVRAADMNLQIAQVYLKHTDPTLSARTWAEVMGCIASLKRTKRLRSPVLMAQIDRQDFSAPIYQPSFT